MSSLFFWCLEGRLVGCSVHMSAMTPKSLQDCTQNSAAVEDGARAPPCPFTCQKHHTSIANSTNTAQGGKNRRRGKNENDNEKRELVFKEEGQEYAQVVKMLGNGRLEAQCFDGARRLAHIRGKLRKKVWINQGDIILLSLRDYQDEKGDVIMKYSGKLNHTSNNQHCVSGCIWV